MPRYRGVRCINWALKNGEVEHGVSLHEIIQGIDEGPIYAQIKFSIYSDFEEVIDVFNRSLNYSFQLLVETLPILEKIKPREQNHSLATHYTRKQNQ